MASAANLHTLNSGRCASSFDFGFSSRSAVYLLRGRTWPSFHTGYLYMPGFRLTATSPFINQENIRFGFQRETDGVAFSGPEFSGQTFVDLLHLPFLKPRRRRRCTGTYFRRSVGMLQFGENGAGNQDTTIDFPRNLRMADANELIQRTGVGDNYHPKDNRSPAARTRSRVDPSDWAEERR